MLFRSVSQSRYRAPDSVAEAEALLDQIEIEGLDDDFEVIDKDLDQL